MIITVEILKTGKGCISFPLDTEKNTSTFDFGEGTLSFTRTDAREICEFSPVLEVREDVCLDRINLRVNLCELLGDTVENILTYDEGICTNDFARIIKLCEADGNASREIFLAKSNTAKFNFAFTSFNRFYTCFEVKGSELVAFINLENKTVKAGSVFTLESIACDTDTEANEFFDRFAALIAKKYGVVSNKKIPAGWSSWSCIYGYITEENMLENSKNFADRFRERGADLIQMDHGWQKGNIFDVFWTNHPEKFPSGIADLGKKIKDMGMEFGIWMAPGIISDQSEEFDNFKPHIAVHNGEMVRPRKGNKDASDVKDGSIYAMNISEDYVKDLVRTMFRRAKEEYGVTYFKIDFLVDMLFPAADAAHPLVYSEGYSVELYRELMRIIRETVGDETFLLSCGAPVGESVGYFDAIRVSPDITWGGDGTPGHPGAWNIMRMDAQNTLLRNSYHRRTFINDPDAVLLRNFDNEYEKDGLNLSFDEAKMWVSTAAMCGGHVLLNEEVAKISDDRLKLFEDIVPPLGIAARPKNFFEYPWCSESYIDIDENTKIVALYNWGDEPIEKVVDISDMGRAVAIDCFDKTIIGVFEDKIDFGALAPHTTKTFVLKRITGKDQFLYSTDGFYLGINTVKTSGAGRELRTTLSRKGDTYILACGDDASCDTIFRGGELYTRVENGFGLDLFRK